MILRRGLGGVWFLGLGVVGVGGVGWVWGGGGEKLREVTE